MASLQPSAVIPSPSKPKVVSSMSLRNRKPPRRLELPHTSSPFKDNEETTGGDHSPTSTAAGEETCCNTAAVASTPANVAKPISKNSAITATTTSTATTTAVNNNKPKRGRKRKVAGVAIALSRQQQQQLTLGDVTNETATARTIPSSSNLAIASATAKEAAIPEPQPGELRLSAFCSKFRSKRKKGDATPSATQQQQQQPSKNNATATNNNGHNGETTDRNAVSAGPVVQIVNGEIVLQESSLYVPTARKSVQEVEDEFQQVVEEETHLAAIGASYNSFVVQHHSSSASSTTAGTANNAINSRAPQHWNVEDTKLFYEALRQVGTDFGTMTSYFPNRNRKQLKRKYQIESAKYPNLIELALHPKVQKEIDLSVFQVDPASIVIPPPSLTIATPIDNSRNNMTNPAASSNDMVPVTQEEQTLAATTPSAPNQTTQMQEAHPTTTVVDSTSVAIPAASGTTSRVEPSVPKRPAWMVDAEEEEFPPPDMDVEEEFRQETFAEVSAAAEELEEANQTNKTTAAGPSTAAVLLGTSAASKATTKSKKPKFKAVRSKPRAK